MNKDMNNLRKTVRPKAHASPRENAMYRSFGSLYSRGKYHIFSSIFLSDFIPHIDLWVMLRAMT